MPKIGLSLFIVLALGLMPLIGLSQTSRPENAPQRVVVQVNRNLEVAGYLALEDDDVIAVRTPKGDVQSFPKSRVVQITRLVDPQPGQTGMVVMRDGQVREGVIIEDAFEHVLIEIQGIRAKLKRDTVSHVVLQPTVDQRYAEYKAALQPGMYDAHFKLCQWLVEQRRYELARNELIDLLEKNDMPEARNLLTVVKAQLAMNDKRPPHTRPDEDDGDPDDSGNTAEDRHTGPVNTADLLPTQIISDRDVNIIRVYEIDFDHPPKVTVSPDTVRELIEKYGTDKQIPASQTGRNALFHAAAAQPLDVVKLMFSLRARDLYPQIQVNSEPYALNMFRQRIHDTWLINTCATSRCHGGPYAGDFFLHRRNSKDDRVRYTNLLILERLQLDPEWPLINYDKPEDSLIIQYGLPRDAARKPHPRVENFKAAFSPVNPKLKDDAIEWIRSMMQPRPQYPVEYDPPRIARNTPAASQPSDPARLPR